MRAGGNRHAAPSQKGEYTRDAPKEVEEISHTGEATQQLGWGSRPADGTNHGQGFVVAETKS